MIRTDSNLTQTHMHARRHKHTHTRAHTDTHVPEDVSQRSSCLQLHLGSVIRVERAASALSRRYPIAAQLLPFQHY